MLVPSFLFGTAREVGANVRKAVTRLKRGATLEEICESSDRVDLATHPDSLVWLEGAWVLRPSAASDYRAILLTRTLFDSARIPFERSNVIREESVEYLSKSPWGTALLNSGQVSEWHTALPRRPLRPSRRAYVAILAGTLRHWKALTAIGARYYTGGSVAQTFSESLPAYGGMLARLGIDPRSGSGGWGDLRLLYDASLIERLSSDDQFWNGLVKKWRSDAKVPDLTVENATEIERLCEAGSWDKAQWGFLRRERGSVAVEQALETVALTCDLNRRLGVFIHGLSDMERATALFTKYEVDNPVLHWADSLIARHLQSTDPERSASILFQAAERAVRLGGKLHYRIMLEHLEEAKDILLGANLEALWKERLARFELTHARRRSAMAMMREKL